MRNAKPGFQVVPVARAQRQIGIVRTEDGERIEPREYLSLTLSFDHDIVEGAPAARFTNRLQDLLRTAELLDSPANGTTNSGLGASMEAEAGVPAR